VFGLIAAVVLARGSVLKAIAMVCFGILLGLVGTDVNSGTIRFGFGDKIAPRLGVSYDVRGDGRMKLFGSWGRYYDWTKYELARGGFGGDIWKVQYRSLDTTDAFSLSGTNLPGRNLWTSEPGSYRDLRIPNFDSTDPNYLALLHYLRVPPDTGTAFFRQRSTGIERLTEATERALSPI